MANTENRNQSSGNHDQHRNEAGKKPPQQNQGGSGSSQNVNQTNPQQAQKRQDQSGHKH